LGGISSALNRLSDFDYSQDGYYFLTICTQNRECLFGEINDGKMILNNYGLIVLQILNSLPQKYPVLIDTVQIMSNHFHAIFQIVGAGKPRPYIKNNVGNNIGIF
jgi:REP element-mobilizing transposase RayT